MGLDCNGGLPVKQMGFICRNYPGHATTRAISEDTPDDYPCILLDSMRLPKNKTT